MIKAILFDLDGVLVKLKESHYLSLNKALKEICNYEINFNEHLKYYDGKTTNTKLKILENRGIVKEEQKKEIWERKQFYTVECINEFNYDDIKIEMCKRLKDDGFKIACVSNSIRDTINKILDKIGILKYFDLILSNEDFKDRSKPNPYPYLLAFEKLNLKPNECLILEDNYNGILSARRSNGYLMEINSVDEVNYDNIKSFLNNI
jgi:HAD superfamily hydrolase (TIGR01509 family)